MIEYVDRWFPSAGHLNVAAILILMRPWAQLVFSDAGKAATCELPESRFGAMSYQQLSMVLAKFPQCIGV